MKPKIFILFVVFLSACTSSIYVRKNTLTSLVNGNPLEWDLVRCNKILEFYTIENRVNKIFSKGEINKRIYIKAIPLNINTVKALSRKEIIEKRLKNEEYYGILSFYLKEFTDLRLDPKTSKIIEINDSSRGYSFKVYFENITSPYSPIYLEDGYSYFFLENSNGDFSRVNNVSGLFVDDFFRVDDFLDAIITFAPTNDEGKKLFSSSNLEESYTLVFNGLEKEPLRLSWIVK